MGLAFLVALVVRLVYLAAFRGSPYFAVPIVDAQWHDIWAWSWARGTWTMDGRAFFRAPLYPFWLSLVYRAFGHDLVAARVVQAVVGAGTASALAGCGWRLGGKRAGLWAGAIASLYGPLIFFDGELLISNLLLALMSWSAFFLLAPSSTRAHLLAFLLLGLAVIARPNALVLLPLFCGFAWSRIPKGNRYRKSVVAGMAAVALLPAAYVTALNARAEGTFVFIASQGGVNFYAGNNPHATGRTLAVEELKDTRSSWADFVQASQEAAESAAGRPLTSREVSDYWSKKASDWIRSSPAKALGLTVKKAWFLANSYELPNERDLYFKRPFPLNGLLWTAGWFSFPWGIVFPLAVTGAVGGFLYSRKRRSVALLAGWVVLYGVSLIPFFICARFRTAMVPPMIVLAAWALTGGQKMLLRPAPVIAGAVAFLIANNNLFDARASDPTQETARWGVTLIAAGRLDEGCETLRAVIDGAKDEPRPPSYLGEFAYHLGDAYARKGKNEEAVRYFRESLRLGCTTVRLLVSMARTLSGMGYYTDAGAALKTALDLHPQDGGLWADLGAALEKGGETERAIDAYRRSILVSPDNPKGYNSLGLLYQNQSETDSAVALWRRGASRVPGSRVLHFNLALAYAQREEYEAALRELDRVLDIAPDDPDARSLREQVEEDIHGR
jgi:Flp pilus assembly protein TadD